MQITQTETVAPTFDAVSLEDVKAWLRVDSEDDDTVIEALIATATRNIERRLEHRLARRTVALGFERFSDIMRLPISPVASISSVTYLDEDGERQTLDADYYHVALATLAPTISRNTDYSWPSHKCQPGSVIVTCLVGYESADDVPADLKHAVAVMVSDHYDNRQGAVASERAVASLLSTYRNGWSV